MKQTYCLLKKKKPILCVLSEYNEKGVEGGERREGGKKKQNLKENF